MPKVSIVIPSYNHSPYIGKAIQSVLYQTEKDLELIVVDDGSTDKSIEIIHRFADPRLRVFPQANCGAHAAINRGLSLASSPFLAILNSDDQYLPTRLEKLVAALEAAPEVGLCGSYIEVVDAKDRVLGIKHGYRDLEPWPLRHSEKSFRATDDLRAVLMTENYWSTTSNFLFSREWLTRVGSFRPLRYVHDWDFALRVSEEAELRLYQEPLMKYRIHGSNTIRENQAAMIFEICWILAVHLPKQTRASWFQKYPIAERTERLLHSIHVFGMDKVLSAMMLLNLSGDERQALELLDRDNPTRAAYTGWIVSQLSDTASGQEPEMTTHSPAENAGFVRKVARKLKRALQ